LPAESIINDAIGPLPSAPSNECRTLKYIDDAPTSLFSI